jgi:PASTA domain
LPFAVTGPGDLQLSSDRTGTTTFTVTNLTGRPVRVRLQPKSSDSQHDSWYSVAGDPEVPMTVGATITVDVRAKVPGDVAAGKDSMHLRAVDEADPEQLTDGQPVAVAIPDPPAPKKKSPFALIALIALVVLLTGGAAIWWFLLRGSGAPTAVAPPVITGNPLVGQVLATTTGAWKGASSTDIQWYACSSATTCTAIPGASGPAYQVSAAQTGTQLKVIVTATGRGGSATAQSALTAPVIGSVTNKTPPVISGTPWTGQVLTTTTGDWVDATSFAVQWYACPTTATCAPIAGATGMAFQLTGAQVGSLIKVTVTATGAAGTGSTDTQLTAPVRAVVQNVISLTVGQAKALLTSYGLAVVVVNDPTNSSCSVVTAQTPGPGAVANKGDVVQLTVTPKPPTSCIYVATIRPTVYATVILPATKKS